jgi:hypothetical protein
MRTLVCVGTNYCNDEQTRTANALFDAEVLEREHPDFAKMLAGFHDVHQGSGYWRTLVSQLRAMLDVEPNYTEDDLRRIPTPTLLIAGETDPWGNLDQALAMRRSIPDSEMLILNHAGMDALANHTVSTAAPTSLRQSCWTSWHATRARPPKGRPPGSHLRRQLMHRPCWVRVPHIPTSVRFLSPAARAAPDRLC